MNNRKKVVFTGLVSSIALSFLLSACSGSGLGLNENTFGAATDLFKAATLSDNDVRTIAFGAAQEMDKENKIASSSSTYGKRLAKITNGLQNEDGLKLNYKVYLVDEINAFAMADGSIRVYSGLLDIMNDNQVRFIIGHEIGHVKAGHIKKATQAAYTASAARKAAAASDNSVVSALSASELGAVGEALLNAQFSQSQEYDADAYGVDFMKRHNYDLNAAVTAMQVLEKASEGAEKGVRTWFSSHPTSAERVERLKKKVQAES